MLAWGTATDVGHRRQVNEDSYIALPPIFAVADGMGGHAAGDLASDAVVTRLHAAAEEGVVDARRRSGSRSRRPPTTSRTSTAPR